MGNSRPAALNAWVKVRLLGRKYSAIPAGMVGRVDENPEAGLAVTVEVGPTAAYVCCWTGAAACPIGVAVCTPAGSGEVGISIAPTSLLSSGIWVRVGGPAR